MAVDTPKGGLDRLDLAAIAYLALPVLIFLLGWLNFWVGLPLAAVLLLGLRDLRPALASEFEGRMRRGMAVFVVVVVVALAWSAMGGAGHLFFANFD